MKIPLHDNSREDLDRKIFFARTEAGWYLDDSGWYSPDGIHEHDWDGIFPEEHLF